MMRAMMTTATTAMPMISGVRDGEVADSCGVFWVKARNASVLPLGSTELSDMRTTIAKRRLLLTGPPPPGQGHQQAKRRASTEFTRSGQTYSVDGAPKRGHRVNR